MTKYGLILVLLITGCMSTRPLNGVVRSASVVHLQEQGRIILMDNTYYSPDRSEIGPLISSIFRRNKAAYSARWDCDDRAMEFVTEFRKAYSQKPTGAESVAAFFWWYDDHVIVKIKTTTGDVYVEPQTGEILEFDERFEKGLRYAF